MSVEVWRDIPGWESCYQISSYGRIRSLPRYVYRAAIARGYQVRGRVLKPNRNGSVNLSRPGDRKTVNGRRLAVHIFGNERTAAA